VTRNSDTGGSVRAGDMKRVTLPLTVEELKLLVSLASDQLFRRQFIDPRMPGYKGSPEEVDRGKALVARMRLIIDASVPQTAVALAHGAPSKEREAL
jgi:hypothetical protein